jgi:PAS domain S-box-containing protein
VTAEGPVLASTIALLEGGGATVAVLVGSGLIVLVALLTAVALLARRSKAKEIREIVLALEALRSGRGGGAPDVDPRSPLALVADATQRLGQDLAVWWGEAEGAADRLQVVLDAVRDQGIFITDTDGDLRSFSTGASALFGWDEDEVVSRPASRLFEPASWKDLVARLARRTHRERGLDTRAVLVRRDGSTFEAQLSVHLLRGPTGAPSGFLCVARDVTARARAEEDLRESESRYQGLVEALSEGVFIVRDGAILYANPAMAALLGATPDEVRGCPLRERVGTRDVLLVQERLAALQGAPAGERDELELVLEGPSGAQPEVRLRAVSILHGGEPAVLAVVREVTGAKRSELELRRNESLLDAVLESTSDGVAMVESTPSGGVVRLANRAFLEMFGLEARQVLGAAEGDLLRLLRERDEGAATVAAFFAAANDRKRETAALGSGTRTRFIELQVAPLAGRDEAPQGRVLLCRDLTDQKQFERALEANAEELRRSKAELEQSYRRLGGVHGDLEVRSRELDRLNRELRTLDEMKSDLLANVSHELQTPLVSIRGYTEMILKGRLGSITEEQRKGLTLSLKNVDRLISMIDNLLSFARIDREAADLRVSAFPLRVLLEESEEMLRSRIQERRLRFEVSFDDPDLVVQADREKILQVFLNLLSNAIKFNRDGGRIEVSIRRGRSGFARVQVRDTGVGIPEDELERVFDRFYRAAPPAEGRPRGTGIGLSIVRSILRLHGCTIQAKSRVGEGTVFTFTLPLARPDSRRAGEEGEAAPGEPEPGDPPQEARGSTATRRHEPPHPESASTPSGRQRLRIIRPGGR